MYTPLIVLCVLSIIAATIGIFYGFGMSGMAAMSRADIENALSMAGFGDQPELVDQMLTLADLGPWFVVFNIVEIIGVVLIMRGLWMGFHVYTASQIGLVGLLVIAVGLAASVVSIMWNLAWVMLYYNLMRRAEIAHDGANGNGDLPSNSDN